MPNIEKKKKMGKGKKKERDFKVMSVKFQQTGNKCKLIMCTELLRKDFGHNFFHTKVGVEIPDSERIVFHNYNQLITKLK